MKLLLIEDSPGLSRSLKRGFENLGHAVDVAGDGRVGLSYARRDIYDVVVLDLMLPLVDGMTVLRTLREERHETPILLLTARDELQDRVKGLNEGADDYLVKPFAFDELHARIEALARRRSGVLSPILEVGSLRIDTRKRRVERDGRMISLTAREYALLLFLAQRRGEIVSRIEIEDHLYGEENFPMSNAVPSAISTLRDKLDDRREPRLIRTHRRMGYTIELDRP